MLTLLDIPVPRLRIDGQELPAATAHAMAEMRISHVIDQPTQCALTLTVDALSPPVRPGQAILIDLPPNGITLFDGTLTGIRINQTGDGTRSLHLRAYDALDRLRTAMGPRSFANASTSEVMTRIAADHRLSLVFEGEDLTWPHLLQTGQSDLSFLRGIARRTGHWLICRGQVIHAIPIEANGQSRALVLDDRFIDLSVETNATAHVSSVTVQGWDDATGRIFDARSDSRLQARFGTTPARAEVLRGGLSPHRAGLRAEATARQRRHDLEAHHMTATLHGPASFDLAETVMLRDDEARLSDPLPITKIVHMLDSNAGFLTRISTRPPTIDPGEAGQAGVLPATVVDVSDPEHLGRVQVSLDTTGAHVSGWLRVVLPAAGADKGLIALPDTGDRVAILQTGAFGEAIVLGGLIGPDRREMGVSGQAVRQFQFATPGGQRIVLDDDTATAILTATDGATLTLSPDETRIEAAGGDFLSFGRSRTTLHSENDLTIEAPGRDMVIAARSVDFRQR